MATIAKQRTIKRAVYCEKCKDKLPHFAKYWHIEKERVIYFCEDYKKELGLTEFTCNPIFTKQS